ncbi:MAG: PTS glucose transporter subunit IIA [Mycoplasmatales bacterium]|nr:PTS glucose transporter subunit IIA [Mycoplasmatales bacterium]
MEIKSPISGKLSTLKSLNDGVFSEEMMGKGFVVEPEGNTVYAPITGKLITVFPTGHAYGIEAKDGTKVLVHIGLDTVGLDGKGFKSLVKQGKKVKVGKPMAEVDFEGIKDKVPSIGVITLVTPDSDTTVGDIKTEGSVTIEDTVAVTS